MKGRALLLTACLSANALFAGDWEHFQGPHGDGISHETGLVSKKLTENWRK